MNFTPHISIYADNDVIAREFQHVFQKATCIFSKHLGFNKKFQRNRLNIMLGKEETEPNKFTSIMSVGIENPFKPDAELSDIEKINQALAIIYKAFIKFENMEGFNKEHIDEAYRLSIKDNGQFSWASDFKLNKRKNLKARVKFSLEDEGLLRIVSEVEETGSGISYEVPLLETFLHFFDWDKIFRHPSWIDDEKYGFKLIDAQLLIFSDLSTRQPASILSPTNWSIEDIERYVRMITFKKFASAAEWMDWVNK